jgi:hypothetical protein
LILNFDFILVKYGGNQEGKKRKRIFKRLHPTTGRMMSDEMLEKIFRQEKKIFEKSISINEQEQREGNFDPCEDDSWVEATLLAGISRRLSLT